MISFCEKPLKKPKRFCVYVVNFLAVWFEFYLDKGRLKKLMSHLRGDVWVYKKKRNFTLWLVSHISPNRGFRRQKVIIKNMSNIAQLTLIALLATGLDEFLVLTIFEQFSWNQPCCQPRKKTKKKVKKKMKCKTRVKPL